MKVRVLGSSHAIRVGQTLQFNKSYPIYITHTKPAETERIMAETQKFDQTHLAGLPVSHDIRRFRAGQEFEI